MTETFDVRCKNWLTKIKIFLNLSETSEVAITSKMWKGIALQWGTDGDAGGAVNTRLAENRQKVRKGMNRRGSVF